MSQDEPAARKPTSDRVRDHLANERTFLAWVRTALGLIGLGFVLARMGLFLRQLAAMSGLRQARGLHAGHEFFLAGIVFLILGTALCAWAAWRYDHARVAIDASRYTPARRSVLVLTAVIVTGSLVIVGLVAWGTLVEGAQ
jgi:putative membrane protein